MKLTFTIAFALITACLLHAQTAPGSCGHDLIHQKTLADPALRLQHEQLETQILQYLRNRKPETAESGLAVVTVPVVVHIIHENGAENIPDALVEAGIQQLNDAFANTGYYDQNSGFVTDIRFCLAQRTPTGQATNGITRHQSPLTIVYMETDDIAMKDLSRWDPLNYINIWLVREICGGLGCGVAGYAYFPAAHGSVVDGIVMEAEYMGSSASGTGVLAHEMGHYFGLYHTFEGGCNNNDCLLDGDRICDTPPDQSTLWVPCNSVVNTCTTDAQSGFTSDQPDMIKNFMDYTDFDCFHDFTMGQSDRMNFVLQNTRLSLLSSQGCKDPCPTPVIAQMTASATTVNVGTTVTFNNQSTNDSHVAWKIGGMEFSTNSVSVNYTFPTEGDYRIWLVAYSNNDLCAPDSTSVIVQVVCPIIADFSISNLNPSPGDTVSFVSNITGATQIEWFLNGVSQGASFPSLVLATEGVYAIRVTASNGLCSRSKIRYLYVTEGGCQETWVREFGEAQQIEGFTNIIPSSDGNFWITGYQGNFTLLGKLGSEGVLFWVERYRFTTGTDERISEIIEDSDGNLVGCGMYTTGQLVGFVFKVNPNTGQVIWSRSNPTTPQTVYFSIIEKESGGNYLASNSYHDSPSPGSPGLSYSIVDMSLNNGLGDVKPGFKNIQLLTNAQFTEKITATRHCNGEDWWIIVKNRPGNGFLTYRLSETGLSAPISSFAGTESTGTNVNGLGELVMSPNGHKLANTNFQSGSIDIMDFNPSTGLITNAITLSTPNLIRVYGLEFSPNGRFLYATSLLAPSRLWQYDLDAGDATGILASGVILAEYPQQYRYGQLQNTPNGKIYVTNTAPLTFSPSLGIIHAPNKKAPDCLYQEGAFNLPSGGANLGLPSWPQDFVVTELFIEISGADTLCGALPTETFKLNNYSCAIDSVAWAVSAGGTILSTSVTDAQIQFSQPGKHTIVAQAWSKCRATSDTLIVTVIGTETPALALGPDQTACDNGVVQLNAGAGFKRYLWFDYSDAQTATATGPGTYWVTVWDSCGNSQTDTMRITLIPATVLEVGDSITSCTGMELAFQRPQPFTEWTWSPSSGLDCADCSTVNTELDSSRSYIVIAKTAAGCLSADTIQLNVADKIMVSIDTAICENEVFLFRNFVFPSDTLAIFNVQQAQGCDIVFIINVTPLPLVQQSLAVSICAGDTYLFHGVEWPSDTSVQILVSGLSGCDTLFDLVITPLPLVQQSLAVSVCAGDTYLFHGVEWPSDTSVQIIVSGLQGCDTLFDLVITPLPLVQQSLAVSVCAGDTYLFHGVEWPSDTSVQVLVSGPNGCDTLFNITIMGVQPISLEFDLEACIGNSVTFRNQTIVVVRDTVLSYSYTTVLGCDSTETIRLTTLDTAYQVLELMACRGESVLYNGSSIMAGTEQLFTFTTSQGGCDSLVLVRVLPFPPTSINLPTVPPTVVGQAVLLEPTASGTAPFTWAWESDPPGILSCLDCPNVEATPINTSQIIVKITDDNGCMASDTLVIVTKACAQPYLPNIFSPGTTGPNDHFTVFAPPCVVSVRYLHVYDRWGELVYSRDNFAPNDPLLGWDGNFRDKAVNPGVFVWIAQVMYVDGSLWSGKGDVTVVR
jgi:PKD repeat protein